MNGYLDGAQLWSVEQSPLDAIHEPDVKFYLRLLKAANHELASQ